MDNEEVSIKLGMRLENLRSGMREAVQNVQHGAHEMGIHVESVGKSGKKILHDLEHISPLLAAGVRAFFDPVVAGMLVVHGLFKDWESFEKNIEKAAEREAKVYARREEAASKVREQLAKANENFRQWEEKMDQGKVGSAADDKLRKRIDAAQLEAGGDKAAFLRKKEQLEMEAAAEADREEAAKRAEARSQNAEAQDGKRSRGILELKAQIQDLLKEEEEAKKESLAGGTGNKFGRWLLGKSGSEMFGVKGGDRAQEAVRDARREQRLLLEGKLAELEAGEQAEKNSLQRTQKEAEKAQSDKTKLDKDAAETRNKLREAEADALKKYLEDVAKAEEKARQKSFEQSQFDRDMNQARRRRTEHENSPYMPTLRELAGAASWNPGDLMQDRFQRQQDQLRMSLGMTYAGGFARQAQSLETLEDDAKRALFIEGPQSERFRRDKEQIKSLKEGLAEAGLQRPDDRLESIDKHIADLLDKASKDGLVVQPVNGA